MKMERLIIQVPVSLKAKLDAERKRGTSARLWFMGLSHIGTHANKALTFLRRVYL